MEGQSPENHPNGQPIRTDLKRPKRDDGPFYEDIFPNNSLGQILSGLCVMCLIKQEPRLGWARKSACNDEVLHKHPNETVAAHQWGVCAIVAVASRHPKFKDEHPEFDLRRAYEMALLHDVPEVRTGDITPVDGITQEEKHRLERIAMDKILERFPGQIGQDFCELYLTYERRNCPESKFVKDCDRLDFIILAFMLERQGFSGFSEFYTNTTKEGFFTSIVEDLAKTITETRNELLAKGLLFKKSDC